MKKEGYFQKYIESESVGVGVRLEVSVRSTEAVIYSSVSILSVCNRGICGVQSGV